MPAWQSALVDRTNAMELPDMSNPLQVLQAVNHLFTLHEPTQAAVKLRELSGLANTYACRTLHAGHPRGTHGECGRADSGCGTLANRPR
jgi:hypothetical protein